MASSRVLFMLLLLVSTFLAEAATSTNKQRKSSARHHASAKHIQKSLLLKSFGHSTNPEAQKKNATAALTQTTPGAAWDKDEDEDDTKDSKPLHSSAPPLISKLKTMFGELKERRDNVVHLETTLKSLESMLQESKRMHHLASDDTAKSTYSKQVKNTQKIYQDTFVLYQQSREEASRTARELTSEMNSAKEVEDAILAEAKVQLKHYENAPMENVLDEDAATTKHSKGSFLAKKEDDNSEDDDSEDDDRKDDDDDSSDSDKDE